MPLQSGAAGTAPVNPRVVAATWAGLYGVLALAWIAATDATVLAWLGDAAGRSLWHTVKGTAFVLLSALALYVVLVAVLQRLAAGERRWLHLVQVLDDVAWVSDASGRLLFVSPAAQRIYGRDPADFLAEPMLWLQLVHPDDRAELQASHRALVPGQARDLEYRILRPDGSQRWLRDRAALVTDPAGHVVGLAGIAEDITEHRQVREAQREQHTRLESIVGSAMEAIITVDRSQVVVLFNRTAGTIFGVAPEDAIGQPLDRFIPARQREIHRERVAQFARDARTDRRMGRLGELTGLRANGEEFPIEASISRSGEGDRQLLTVVLRDVTEQRRTEQAQRAQQVAEAASRAKSTFLANMSHELRTPLSAVLGLSQLMQADRSEPLGERQAVRVEQIRTAGTHLLALINDALDLARIEAGALQIATEAVDLFAVLADAVALCHALAGRHRVAVHVLAPDTAPLWVQGDALRVRQVLINLLSNAVKYSHPGGEVVLRLEPQAAWGVLEIEDHGLGMTAQQLAHLYEPFNRLGRDARSIEGTGIGLVLTRQLVEGMAGRLEIRSEAGQGTCVKVALPRVDATRVDPAPAAPTAAVASIAATIEPAGLVLYIEDNPVNVAVVEGLLSHWDGVSVASAARGQLGIEMARRLLPGLVLLDMGLPDLDGVAVLTALRQDPRTAGLPVVMLSASAQPDEVARAMQAGAVEYLGKPVDFQRLAATVARLLPPATSMPAPVADPG